jgi:hypothetical protein
VLGYVENMSGYYCADCEQVRPLFPISDAVDLGLPCLGQVPFDPALAASCDRGAPIADTDGAAARALARIADRIFEAMEQDG